MIAKADLQLVLSSGAAIRKVMGGGGSAPLNYFSSLARLGGSM